MVMMCAKRETPTFKWSSDQVIIHTTLPPIIMESKMVPSNSSYRSNIAIFIHFPRPWLWEKVYSKSNFHVLSLSEGRPLFSMNKSKSHRNWIHLVGGWATHLKNMSQIGHLPQIGVKIKNIGNHHLVNLSISTASTLYLKFAGWFHHVPLSGFKPPIQLNTAKGTKKHRLAPCIAPNSSVRYYRINLILVQRYWIWLRKNTSKNIHLAKWIVLIKLIHPTW